MKHLKWEWMICARQRTTDPSYSIYSNTSMIVGWPWVYTALSPVSSVKKDAEMVAQCNLIFIYPTLWFNYYQPYILEVVYSFI